MPKGFNKLSCGLGSMNAPVMVELEGETDPLEVRFFKSCASFLNFIVLVSVSCTVTIVSSA